MTTHHRQRRQRSHRAGRPNTAPAAALLAAASIGSGCLPEERPVAINASCDGEQCQCDAGYGNCDADPHNGCETELALDPRNCGQCGRDCFRGSCAAGRCTPYLVTPPLMGISGLDTHGDDVFLCDPWAGTILHASLLAERAEILLSDQNCWMWLAVGGDRLYWKNIVEGGPKPGNRLWSVALDGTALELVAFDGYITSVAADESMVAWLGESAEDDTDQRVWAATTDGNEATDLYALSPTESLTATAVAQGWVYWALSRTSVLVTTSRILRASPSDPSPELVALVHGYEVSRLEAVGETLYWVEADSSTDVVTQAETYRLMRQQGSGGPVAQLWADDREIDDVAADESGVYWNAGGDVLGLLDGHREVELLADNQQVEDLALATSALVWHDSPNELRAMAK